MRYFLSANATVGGIVLTIAGDGVNNQLLTIAGLALCVLAVVIVFYPALDRAE